MEDIRYEFGKKFRIVKVKCTCPCHTDRNMMHFLPCCDENQMVEVKELIPE